MRVVYVIGWLVGLVLLLEVWLVFFFLVPACSSFLFCVVFCDVCVFGFGIALQALVSQLPLLLFLPLCCDASSCWAVGSGGGSTVAVLLLSPFLSLSRICRLYYLSYYLSLSSFLSCTRCLSYLCLCLCPIHLNLLPVFSFASNSCPLCLLCLALSFASLLSFLCLAAAIAAWCCESELTQGTRSNTRNKH